MLTLPIKKKWFDMILSGEKKGRGGLSMDNEKMTVPDARKLLQIMNDCCKSLIFTKDEVSRIATICLKAI